MKVIYLDFDGVLHPDEVYQDARGRVYLCGRGQLFEHAQVIIHPIQPYAFMLGATATK